MPCRCTKCKGSQQPHFFTFDNLQKRVNDGQDKAECYISYEMVNVFSLIDAISSKLLNKLLVDNKELQALLKDKGQPVVNNFYDKTEVNQMNVNAGRDINAKNIAGKDIVEGDKAGGDIVHGDNYVALQDALKQWQAQIIANIEAQQDLDEDEKVEMKEEVAKNAEKVLAERQDEVRPGRIERLLNTVAAMGDDILEVTMATLANPLAGVGLVVKKINERIKLERAKEAKQDSAA